jgi:hypothetical protein
VLAFAALSPSAAHALAIAPASVRSARAGELDATLEFVEVRNGAPAGGQLLEGAIGPGDSTVVFRLRLGPESTSLAELPIVALLGPPPTTYLPFAGAGWIPGPDRDVEGVTRDAEPFGGDRAVVAFDTPLVAGNQSDLFFVAWGELAEGNRVGMSITRIVFSTPTAQYAVRVFVGGQVVPEPATAALLALGLAVLRARSLGP